MAKQRVGFIGLGLMGAPMAANVARAGYPLLVYNRSGDKAAPLRELGAAVVETPKEVAAGSDVVITMLSDASAVEQVLRGEDGLLAGGRPGMVLIDMSTVAPEQSRSIAIEIGARGWQMLDAPVFGSTGPAKDGKLGIMVGGDAALFEAQRELLGVLGKFLTHLGPQGAGAVAKLAFNLMVAAQLTSLAEAMTLAVRGGIEAQKMAEVILASNVSSELIQRKVGSIVSGNFAPAFPLRHMHKDLGLMIDTGHAMMVPLPATAAIHELFTTAMARGRGDQDFMAIYGLLAELAGLR